MYEYHPAAPDTLEIVSPTPLHPADLGGLAASREVELLEYPAVDVQQLESERKMNTSENLRVLRMRFGERFIKGDLMEGGGYTGGGARELLAGFMDRPDFVNRLKRLIPGRYGALQLLKDNHAYIQATLEQAYKDDPGHESAPAKDPYELARSVGYELTGPFTSTSEFVPYDKQDFPPGRLGKERLCTFNKPAERLQEYNILWLRHSEVADTLPADQLKTDNLNDNWKTYLKTIGRYDKNSDRYDLAGLRPTRDDPYGTSSMSVQISREGIQVSVKNRYNHAVGNPDNTLDSNLDNVAYGLKRAVYTLVGREDLMNKTSVALADKYIADNDGGIHHYKYEEDNMYFGDYEYISNGVVNTINRGKYYMISPQIYVPKIGKGDELRLGQRAKASGELAASTDVQFLYGHSSKSDEKDPLLAELRREYAERDQTELAQKLCETLMEQAEGAYNAYKVVVVQLGVGEIMTEAAFAGLLERKVKQWHANGVMEYLVKELVEKGSRPNLVATPNVIASWQQLKQVAVEFGKDQPHTTGMDDAKYEQYTPEELSGALTDEALRVSIIPSSYNVRSGSVSNQREQMADMQSRQPELSFRVPSVLDSLMLWHSLRARGNKLDADAFDVTYIRHFDVPEKEIYDCACVPYSGVYDSGKPGVGASIAVYDNDGRLSVG